jgi:oxygen-independent coproporphyrinogen-3 oxidase
MKTYTPMMAAMLREIELRKNILTSKKLSSVYFGGGTPSLLAEKDLFAFVQKIHSTFDVEASAEITLEANPDDLTIERLRIFKAAGINRLSIGTQSFFDDELKLMNRVHNAQEAESAIKRAQDAGFENITIDLMYGMPGNINHRWQQNVAKAISLQVPHVSAYALTVEPKTALAKMVKNGEVVLPNDDTIAQQYHHLCREMAVDGFNHYELSNFGKPGFYSAHNTAYWNGTPYLGIGPGAHSFVEHMRQANVANNSIYLQKVNAGEPWWETEEVDEKDRLNEYLMTGLRTARGVSITTIENNFGTFAADKVLREAANYLECGRLQLNDDNLIIPEKEWLISDRIISDLFWV